MMWIRLWLIQKPTQKKNSRPYTARSCLILNDDVTAERRYTAIETFNYL